MTATGALAIIDHQMTIGALIASNMLTGRLLGPLNLLVGSWRTVLGFRQSAGRLGMLFAETEEPQRRVIALERPRGRLVAEELSFAYDNERPVVDTVTVAVEPGGLTAILGRNGSGKTTLVKLLQGLYRPLHGRVLLDGGDIGQFTRRELADWIGYVPQETVLLSGSIRDNLAHGAPGASDAQIVAAAVKAGAHDFILDLPAGYGTPVGEAGARLSGGQRQRLAIARALIGDPPVLILDEPSANLDRRAEEELRETLLELAQDRSVLLVTHSPILLSACLSVVVLEAGRVVASGAANEVLPSLFQSAQPQPRPLPAPPHPLRRPRQVGAPA